MKVNGDHFWRIKSRKAYNFTQAFILIILFFELWSCMVILVFISCGYIILMSIVT